jgi:sugar phosphate isomerase/epimerase
VKYAICNEVYGDWLFEKSFAHARKTGYSGLEIAPFTINENAFSISAERRRQVRDLAAQNDLEIVGLHWLLAKTTGYHLTCDDPEVRAATAEYLCELARLCRDLGGHVMVFGSPPQRNLPSGVSPALGFDRAVEVFKQIAPTLEECEVVLALEPLGPEEGNFLMTAQSGIELATAVDSSNVKLHLDVKAMSTESQSIPDIIRASQDWLVHFHANDPNRRGPGMGEVDFGPIMGALDAIGYDGWISVEVFDYSPGIDALTGESIRYLKQFEATL